MPLILLLFYFIIIYIQRAKKIICQFRDNHYEITLRSYI